MNIKHNNHFVPQMYLSAWGTDKKIYQYRLLVSNEEVPLWSRPSIEHTASQDFLYVRVVDGIEIDDFETEFNEKYENPAKIPLRKAIAGEQMSSRDWDCLIRFMTAQYVRTPSFYLQNKKIEEKVFPEVLDRTAKELEKLEKIPQAKHNSISSELMPVEVSFQHDEENDFAYAKIGMISGKSTWMLAMKHFLEDQSVVLNAMKSRKWSIAQANSEILFPTSDNPFIIFTVNNQGVYSITDGLGRPENIFAFPISPHKVLLSTSRKIKPRFVLTKEETLMVKNLIAYNAYESVFSFFEDPEIPKIRQRIVDEQLFKENKAKFDNWHEVYKSQEGPFLHRR